MKGKKEIKRYRKNRTKKKQKGMSSMATAIMPKPMMFQVDSKKKDAFIKASQNKEPINKMLSRVNRLRKNKIIK